MRVALRTECEYEWANHTLGALGAGATKAEIEGLSNGSASWSDADAALFCAVDELCSDDCISDDTWAALKATRDDVQIIEIIFVVGYYRMTAGFLNSVGVQPEPGRPHLGQLPALSAVSPQRSPASRRSETDITGGATTNTEKRTALDGTWQVVFHHPAADLDLTIVMDTRNGGISGSVTSSSQGTSVKIVEGKVEGNRFSFKAPMTTPVHMDIRCEGIVDGDLISGHVTVQGAGIFPFSGTRI
ncbi:carboxymuconolactone decarboxylase family protein [Methanosarcina sp.]|uniref:carboxymuconolactone decarboxylase family protein n=1 Tax=Methanosarcina sp. TaxID=2213 RepID=UPI003C795600